MEVLAPLIFKRNHSFYTTMSSEPNQSKYSPPTNVTVPPEEEDRLIRLACEIFGYSNVRDYQLKAAYAMLQGIDTSVILGTGAGKSLCYALAALAARNRVSEKKMVIVVSPLIALMKDQVRLLPLLLLPGRNRRKLKFTRYRPVHSNA